MCTVVVGSRTDAAPRVLALRDELVGRDFDEPDRWWPEQPDVVGGRDRAAGGSWCVTDVRTGTTALVLNRPQRRVAEPGAPSRGVLPLRAVQRGAAWREGLDLSGMASFALVLVRAGATTVWAFDGVEVTERQLPPGTHMITSGGAEDGKAERYLDRFDDQDWAAVVQAQEPADDPASLLVRHPAGDQVFATVFGQLIEATPGALTLSYSRSPTERPWRTRTWTA